MSDSLQCEHCGRATRLAWEEKQNGKRNHIVRVARMFIDVETIQESAKVEYSASIDVEAAKRIGAESMAHMVGNQIARAIKKVTG